ncbi:MAG: hypothetical protein JWN08_1260 [Frankiales bacterium]|jgi:uncharacterized protein YlxW (UPF0749 family)|nr:hypothetical protein [Frankiales bacterium]
MTRPAPGPAGPGPSRLRRLLTPRLRRVDLAVAALLAVLGFAAVVQVRSTQEEGPLAAARQEDLVQILDELANRNDRLRAEVSALERTREDLTSGTGANEAALADARRRTQLLGVLAGSVTARGPGLRLTISDPQEMISAGVLLGALEELRAAGAEAMQVEGPVAPGDTDDAAGSAVRVVASTSLLDGEDGGIVVDGTLLRPPYRFTVLGDPTTMETALGIPGGVVDTVEQLDGRAVVVRGEDLLVGALRAVTPPRYARPAS